MKHCGNTETSKKVTVHQKSLQKVSEKFKNIPWKTPMVVYFDLTLAKKNFTTDGFFWDYLGKPSWRSSVLQMQSFETIRMGYSIFYPYRGMDEQTFKNQYALERMVVWFINPLELNARWFNLSELRKKWYLEKIFSLPPRKS